MKTVSDATKRLVCISGEQIPDGELTGKTAMIETDIGGGVVVIDSNNGLGVALKVCATDHDGNILADPCVCMEVTQSDGEELRHLLAFRTTMRGLLEATVRNHFSEMVQHATDEAEGKPYEDPLSALLGPTKEAA